MVKKLQRSMCAGILLAAFGVGAPYGANATAASAGKAVFGQCQVCHSATTMARKVGPSLKGLFKHARLQNGKAVTDQNVRAMIDQGGNGMPSYADILSAQQKDDVIAYLKTL